VTKISQEDVMMIKNLYLSKKYGARRLSQTNMVCVLFRNAREQNDWHIISEHSNLTYFLIDRHCDGVEERRKRHSRRE